MQQPPPGYGQGQGYGPPPPQGYGTPQAFAPHGYGPQGYGPPPKKKGMSAGMIALIVIGSLFGGCTVLGAIGAASSTPKSTAAASGAPAANDRAAVGADPKPAAVKAPSALPWTSAVEQNCASYKSAPNEIKQSAIFRANQALLASASVTNARGTLKRLSTNQGGSEVALMIEAEDVEFATESLFAPIKRGSAVYDQASELTVGSCVVFSARKLRPSSVVERSQVCDLEYFAEFTSIAPCN